MEMAIEVENQYFAWRTGMAPVLKIERLHVPRGERVFIEGPSGSGKRTLVFVSHDTSLAGMFDRRVRLTDINAI